jgi:MFS family permease
MAGTHQAVATHPAGNPSLLRGLWDRRIERYPDTAPRTFYLAIVVLATIVLYYELYVQGAIAPTIMRHYGMSFTFFVYISVVGNIVCAFASLLAGLADRWGRANLVAYGLGVVAFLLWFGLPNAPGKDGYLGLLAAVSFVEGIILVATPALVRDYSPQLGRASAMGFWTHGPVIGSMIVAEYSSHTLSQTADFNDQFRYAGWAGMIVFVLALLFLRELSPRLRDQLMVSMRDRALIEARAQGIDVEASLQHPWRQMLHLDVVGSAFAISIFLMIYYTMVGFSVIYFTTVFGFSQSQANGLGNWLWAFDAGALIVVGLLSDWIKVRKPFMVFGALGSIAMTIYFLMHATRPSTSYYDFVFMLSLLAVFLAITYAPWMASFTETVERRNPALTATGLAVWGWIIRVIVALSAVAIPLLVTSVTPLVEHGADVAAVQAKYPQQVKTIGEVDPATLGILQTNPTDQSAVTKAVGEIAKAEGIAPTEALQRLVAVGQLPANAKETLAKYGTKVATAAMDAPHEWQKWFWVCVGCEVAFIPFVFVMTGRWSPRRAREDAQQHEEMVQRELAALTSGS